MSEKQPLIMAEDSRLPLDVSNKAKFAEELRPMVGCEGGPLAGVFRRRGELVHTPREGEAGYIEPEGDDEDGPAQVQPLTSAQFKALVEIRFNCGQEVETKQTKQRVWVKELTPGDAILSVYNGIAQSPEATENLRPLRMVTHTPMLRPDGTVLSEPGYDKSTSALYLPAAGLDVPPIPEKPTTTQVAKAVKVFLALTDEFPFVHEDHRATWCGFAMTPLMRAILGPPYPLGIMNAPNPGSGKGFLARMIRDLHGGVLRGELPRDPEELRKAITAALLSTTAPCVQFDNLTGTVRSSVLEALFTTDTWTDRYLGFNRNVTIPNDRVWLATGNTATIGGDLSRRVLWMDIDPKMPNPHMRTGFKIHPPSYVPAHKGEILAAMLTIAAGWVQDGSPTEVNRSDDYAIWAGAMTGLLHFAKIPGTFGGEAAQGRPEANEDEREWAEWLEELHRMFGLEIFQIKDVVTKLDPAHVAFRPHVGQTLDAAKMPAKLTDKWARVSPNGGKTSGFAKSLGRWCLYRAGRYAEGWRIEMVEEKASAKGWRVVPPEGWKPPTS
jgi:hypothetical protein